jgi:hypothetical protein
LFLSGCVQITGTIEEVCLSPTSLQIEGSPVDAAGEIEHSFVIDDFTALDPIFDLGLEAEVYFTESTLRSDRSFGFVRGIQLVGSSRDLPAIDLGSCADETCSADAELVLSADEVDMMRYIDTGALDLDLTVSGELPREDWTLDVDVCLRGSLSFEAGF